MPVNQAMVAAMIELLQQFKFPRGGGARRGLVGTGYRDGHGIDFVQGFMVDGSQPLSMIPE